MTWARCVVVILQHETIQKETFLQHIERKSRVTRPYEILAEGDLVSNLTFLIRDQTNSCRQNETYRLLKRRLNRFGCSDRRITPVWLIQVSGNFPTLLSYTAVQRCLCSYTEHVDIFPIVESEFTKFTYDISMSKISFLLVLKIKCVTLTESQQQQHMIFLCPWPSFDHDRILLRCMQSSTRRSKHAKFSGEMYHILTINVE